MHINDNTLDLSKHKGAISPCPSCSNLPDAAKLERLTSGKACNMCLGNQFIATCLNCEGTGQYKGRTVWDGGRSEHASTCTPCGGKGAFPARKPSDWVDPVVEPAPESAKVVEPVATTV